MSHATRSGPGVAVRLDVEGAIDALPVDVRTTVLRIVQEAVTNAVRHAGPCSVVVTLRVSSDEVCVRVEDDGPGAHGGIRPGHGLIGLRERVELRGGTVAFASSASGFVVTARLPVVPAVGGRG